MSDRLLKSLEALLEPLLEERGIELVDIEQTRKGRKQWIRLFIDRIEGGISVEQCAKINQEFGRLLDVEELVPGSYILEVSSPGLDRRVRKLKDFKRFQGNRIRVQTLGKVDGQSRFRGQLKSSNESGIELELEDRIVQIPHEMIARANLEYTF